MEAAAAIAEATCEFRRGIKKSFKRQKTEASRFCRQMSDIIDVEDILKSIHKARYPNHHHESTVIIHSTIDWSKHPPRDSRQPSVDEPNSCDGTKSVHTTHTSPSSNGYVTSS